MKPVEVANFQRLPAGTSRAVDPYSMWRFSAQACHEHRPSNWTSMSLANSHSTVYTYMWIQCLYTNEHQFLHRQLAWPVTGTPAILIRYCTLSRQTQFRVVEYNQSQSSGTASSWLFWMIVSSRKDVKENGLTMNSSLPELMLLLMWTIPTRN